MGTKYIYREMHMPVERLDPELQAIHPICLDILYKRGYQTSESIRSVLFPPLEQAIQPLKCRDISPALKILSDAVKHGLPVVVYRDYDVDGITAGALAVECLSHLGAVVHHYANDRETDGFGICKNGIDAIMSRWPETKIILTVDNGIAGHEAISYAASLGLTVVVTDHHEPDAALPEAAAVVDLKRHDESYPFRDLCGCALIFRVMLDLYRSMHQDLSFVFQTLDLVALATVADVVPLLQENRALVLEGLKLIEAARRPFFKALFHILCPREINAHYTLAFQYAPILNSLSRMGRNTDLAVEALVSRDESWVEEQVMGFHLVNQERKELTQSHLECAQAMLGHQDQEPAIILYNEQFKEGIVGILAGRLKELYWKPTIVLAPSADGVLKGSARSIEEFSLKDHLEECSDLLVGFGGHKKAAGLSILSSNLPAFTSRFNSLVSRELAGSMLQNTITLEAVLTETTLTPEFVQSLRILEPFGEGFPEPVFGLKAIPDRVRYMGSQEQHVRYTCSQSGLDIVIWNKADIAKSRNTFPSKFIGRPQLNNWNNSLRVQFIQRT